MILPFCFPAEMPPISLALRIAPRLHHWWRKVAKQKLRLHQLLVAVGLEQPPPTNKVNTIDNHCITYAGRMMKRVFWVEEGGVQHPTIARARSWA